MDVEIEKFAESKLKLKESVSRHYILDIIYISIALLFDILYIIAYEYLYKLNIASGFDIYISFYRFDERLHTIGELTMTWLYKVYSKNKMIHTNIYRLKTSKEKLLKTKRTNFF